MYDWKDFDTVFDKASNWTYEQDAVQAILLNRQSMDGVLFFDRIWESLGLEQAENSYPPRSNGDLRKLFGTIVNASTVDHQKHAIIYYILKDCKSPVDHREAFARKVYLPRKYKLLISGLHDLDQGQAKQALELLTDPSLTPTFADHILYTLLHHPKLDNSLAMAYYVTVCPPLNDQKVLVAYFSFLCYTNLVHAYHFCHTHVGWEQKLLFEQLILAALSTKGADIVRRMETLIGLPFSDAEVHWFEDFLLNGKGSSYHGAKDSVIMRRIATGKGCANLQQLQRFRGQKIDGLNWVDVQLNLQPGVGGETL